ncbi:MAG: hemolysin III [Proteobacteria bacterium]|nr:hemolysin III [Pseudomonadota bacterium]
MSTSSAELSRPKPRLRGVSHLWATVAAIVAGAVLVALASSGRARLAGTVYSVSLATMFGVSALYHVPTWSPGVRQWLRRLDHASIFLFIAGSYTPFCLLALRQGEVLLGLAWLGAGLGILQALFWIGAPRVLSASIYLALGWMVVPYLSTLTRAIGGSGVALVGAGGVCFTVGAVIYTMRRPDPLPATFGYHEIFHALVIAGCVLQGCVVARLIMQP